MKRIIYFISVLLFIVMLSSCLEKQTDPMDLVVTDITPERSSTLEQISEYPLYVYFYSGDYGFEEYLQTGEYGSKQGVITKENTYSCSCFSAFGDERQAIFGRNFDWYYHPVLILFTQPSSGYRSVSMVDISYLGYDVDHSPLDDPQALLQTPYIPFDGMNEMGLAVGMMSIAHAEGGDDPQKVTIGSLELMRLLLDYAGNVEEAIRLIQDYNVDFEDIPVHYMIADKEGHSAIIEYIDGEPLVVRNDQEWQVSTNFLITEASSLGTHSTCWRYNLLEKELQRSNGVLDVQTGMGLLSKVSQAGDFATRWSVVYDLTHAKLQVAIGGEYNEVYEFSLDQ